MTEWSATPDDEIRPFKNMPGFNQVLSPSECMQLACDVALAGVGWVGKNPLVGAVAVDRDHKFIAAGAHLKCGEAHAEANLIRTIQNQGLDHRLDSATIYVTLEPCCFHGRTPGCAQLLAKFPIKTVVYGTTDTHKLVNGKGISYLEDAGIGCHSMPDFTQKVSRLSERSLWFQSTKTPFVGLKAGLSQDGIYAFEKSSRTWITNKRARAYGHWLRQLYDGILIGPDTLLTDNPSLNIRTTLVTTPNHPRKVILDSTGRALMRADLADLNCLKSHPETVIWCLSEQALKSPDIREKASALEKTGAQYIKPVTKPSDTGTQTDLRQLLESLGSAGMSSLLVEGGAGIWHSFLASGLVQKSHLFQSFKTLGPQGLHWTRHWENGALLNPDDKTIRVTGLDNNILIEARINPPKLGMN